MRSGDDFSVHYKLVDAIGALTLETQVIVREETAKHNRYIVCQTPNTVAHMLQQQRSDVSYHEVLRNDMPCRMFFDLDMPRTMWGDENPYGLESKLITEISNAVQTLEPFASPPLIATSSDYVEKISLHVILLDVRFKTLESAKQFAFAVRSQLNSDRCKEAVDMSYSKSKSLRLLGSYKLGSSRKKCISVGDWSSSWETQVYRSLRHDYDKEVSETLDFKYRAQMPTISMPLKTHEVCPDLITKVLKLVESAERSAASKINGIEPPLNGAYTDRSVSKTSNGVIFLYLTRRAPSICIVCERVHEHENPWLIIKGDQCYFKCRRNPDRKLAL